MKSPFSNQQIDFIYWHAVSKMRISLFKDAATLFRLIVAADPKRMDALVGRIYCLVREGDFTDANSLIDSIDRKQLNTVEANLVVRLKRRCEYEMSALGA